jgi:ribosomal protein S30
MSATSSSSGTTAGQRSGEATPLLPASGSRPQAPPRHRNHKAHIANALESASKRASDPAAAARMSDILREFDDGQAKSRKQLWFGIFSVANHFLGGILTFHVLEGWSLIDCAYFTVVVTTTVGESFC